MPAETAAMGVHVSSDVEELLNHAEHFQSRAEAAEGEVSRLEKTVTATSAKLAAAEDELRALKADYETKGNAENLLGLPDDASERLAAKLQNAEARLADTLGALEKAHAALAEKQKMAATFRASASVVRGRANRAQPAEPAERDLGMPADLFSQDENSVSAEHKGHATTLLEAAEALEERQAARGKQPSCPYPTLDVLVQMMPDDAAKAAEASKRLRGATEPHAGWLKECAASKVQGAAQLSMELRTALWDKPELRQQPELLRNQVEEMLGRHMAEALETAYRSGKASILKAAPTKWEPAFKHLLTLHRLVHRDFRDPRPVDLETTLLAGVHKHLDGAAERQVLTLYKESKEIATVVDLAAEADRASESRRVGATAQRLLEGAGPTVRTLQIAEEVPPPPLQEEMPRVQAVQTAPRANNNTPPARFTAGQNMGLAPKWTRALSQQCDQPEPCRFGGQCIKLHKGEVQGCEAQVKRVQARYGSSGVETMKRSAVGFR